ncbi:hypothetical protein MBRA1_002271 [Malassezia brasiliensis]|uniref:Uncharacterized protein n=1 Tax=Malassezia brasiliensis TaxID=1821822 RepID=A0AAF0DXZ0_9BASI|nr:hypothetical protein MBRA1_002271 [Malassezia brasiliensis]
MPVFGALVRVRAAYRPVSSDHTSSASGAHTDVRAFVRGLFSHWNDVVHEIQHTRAVEGIRGLYRGSTVAFVQIVGETLLSFLVYERASVLGSTLGRLPHWVRVTGSSLVLTLMDLPFEVVLQRCAQLLSRDELRAPWRLYAVPGLLPAVLLRKVWTMGLFLVFPSVLFPRFVAVNGDATPGPEGSNVHTLSFSWAHLLGYVVWNGLSLVVALPLDCIITRLATQRDTQSYAQIDAEDTLNTPVARDAENAPDGAPDDQGEGASHAPPAVLVHLRPSGRPYTTMWDCLTTMLAEEGPTSLTRGAGVALAALLLEHAAAPGQ